MLESPATEAVERLLQGPPAEEAVPAIDAASVTIRSTLAELYAEFLAQLPLIVAGLIVLAATAVAAFITRRVIRRSLRGVRFRESLKELIGRFTVLALWAIGLLLAAMVAFPGLTPTKALTALGIGSIAVGLAFKDIFENFFAGVLILWRFPFENGDFITCNGITGRVVDVTVRNTILRTVQGELVVIPNVDIFKNPVDVLTDRPRRRVDIIASIAYGESIDRARGIIRAAVARCPTVSDADEVQVFAKAFGESSIDFEVAWWTGSTPLDQRRSRDEVVGSVKSALDHAGIEIPFPQRTLWFRSELPLRPLRRDNGHAPTGPPGDQNELVFNEGSPDDHPQSPS